MEPKEIIELMKTMNQLKDVTRHSWTKQGRHESVAEHTFSMMAAAYFMHTKYPNTDLLKILSMCLFHDIGEAFTGDIPAFDKTAEHEQIEAGHIQTWLASLPENIKPQLTSLLEEMEAMETLEAKIYKALDKTDVLIMHNEASIDTWIPLEYELNLTYGNEQTAFDPMMKTYRDTIREDSLKKIEKHK